MEPTMRRIADTINVGVADTFFTPEGSNLPIYLGLTKDGATFNYETNWHELTADQTGTTPLDDVLIGESATLTTNVLNTTKEHIAAIVPPATAATNATTFGQRPGLRATHHSGRLVLHPISAGFSTEYDVIIYRTANTGNLELAYQLDAEWVIPCEFKAYMDDWRRPGDQLFRIGGEGDESTGYKRVVKFEITPVNATVAPSSITQFRANAMYEDGSQEDVTQRCTWLTSDDTIAAISGQGTATVMVNALSTGSVIVRAEFIGYSVSTSLVVAS